MTTSTESIPDSSIVSNNTPDQRPSSNFSIQIHSILQEAQQAHGLAYSDYTSYRTYLTHRISRLRHSKPVYKRKSGKRNVYQKRVYTVEELNEHENFILIHLYTAERAWAHAMELKYHSSSSPSQDDIQSNNSKVSFRKNYYIQRLKKSVKHVDELEPLVGQFCDETTCKEFHGYAAWMRGNYFCETKSWENACKEYSKALGLCRELSQTMLKTMDLQGSDLFASRADNVLQPLLRYCLYEWDKTTEGPRSDKEREECMAMTTTMAAKTVDRNDNNSGNHHQDLYGGDGITTTTTTTTTTTNGGSMMKRSFRGKEISITDASVSIAFIKIENIQNAIHHNMKGTQGIKVEVMERKVMELLNSFDDAVDVLQKLLDKYRNMTSGPTVNEKRLEYSTLLGYCKYEKLKIVMDRNEKIVDRLRQNDVEMKIEGGGDDDDNDNSQERYRNVDFDAKCKLLEDISHLYDALLQDARSVVDLPGMNCDDIADGTMEDDFILEANANTLRIRAFRCYYIGRMYLLDSVGKYKEALALFHQASRLAHDAAEEIAACQDMENGDALIEGLLQLEDEITVAKCRAKASVILACNPSGAFTATSGMNLLRRLDDFDSGGSTCRLTSVPPALEMIAAKPFFFDIANNYLRDMQVGDIENYIISTTPVKRQGIQSWLRKSR